MDDKFAINLIFLNNKTLAGSFTLFDESAQNSDQVELCLEFEDSKIVKIADDYFTALCEIRLELEAFNLKPFCYGASKNIFPSGMSTGMGCGILAYKLRLGHQALRSDLVNIFHSGHDIEIATVAEQRQFFEQWISGYIT